MDGAGQAAPAGQMCQRAWHQHARTTRGTGTPGPVLRTGTTGPACHHGQVPPLQDYRSLSFWLSSVPGELDPGDPLPGDTSVDVAIAGAGFTGLWTAYYLAGARPGLRIAVCEREIAGFGASGRNGGWCSALFPASLAKLERMAGRGRSHRHVPGHAGHRGRGRPGGRGRGHRLPLGQGRDRAAGPLPGPAGPGPRGGRGGAVVRVRRGRPAAADRGGGPRSTSPRPGCWAARTPRTAPPSTRPGWPAGWRTRCGGAGSSCTSAPRSPGSSPGGCAPRGARSGPRT